MTTGGDPGSATGSLSDSLELAATVCTEKQMEVLRLRDEGLGVRLIARRLLITPRSAKDRLDAADLHLQRAIRDRGGEDEHGVADEG